MNIILDTEESTTNFIQMMKGWRIIFQIRKILKNKRSHHEQIAAIKRLVR